MDDSRRQEILTALVRQIETAGHGGFAALKLLGEVRFKRPPPLGLRRQASIGNIVDAINISEIELLAFRDEITPEIREKIRAAKEQWYVAIQEVWKKHLARLDTENAAKS